MSAESRSGGGRPRDERIAERVLTATRQLLVDRGLQAMSLDAVAERAGVSRSTIYRRWASSDELVLDAIDDALGQLPGPNPTVASDAFWAELREGLRVAVAGLANPIEHDAIQLWLGRLTHQPRLHRRYWERRIPTAARARDRQPAVRGGTRTYRRRHGRRPTRRHARWAAPLPLLPDPQRTADYRNRRAMARPNSRTRRATPHAPRRSSRPQC